MRKDVLRNFTKSQNPLENTCDRVSFSIIKKGTLAHVFSCEFCKISKNTFFAEHLWAAASIFEIFP